ncbi:MAG: pentapeptide repeat-containing protein [Planctomycetes bacterium]|nr:pentapeptide repeat-containing protein [Planctomycetota bacterium]
MIVAKRAPVKPRVRSPVSGEAVPLEDEIRGLIEVGTSGVVRILGPQGSGKTVALEHLAAILPCESKVTLLDEPELSDVTKLLGPGLVVLVSSSLPSPAGSSNYWLLPWNEDDLIEYLLAAHKEACSSVMACLRAATDRSWPEGIPELWRIVLDQMACDESVLSPKAALRRYLETQLKGDEERELARTFCLNSVKGYQSGLGEYPVRLVERGCKEVVLRALRHRPVQILVAAERIAGDLRAGGNCKYLIGSIPVELVREVATDVASDQKALDHLQALLAAADRNLHAMAASILHATHTGWEPEAVPDPSLGGQVVGRQRLPALAGAYLDHAEWPGIDLELAEISGADLSCANLKEAKLDGAVAWKANFSHAVLRGASLQKFSAAQACLAHADLSRVRATEAVFDGADLERAEVRGASLESASFEGANLAKANFTRADLSLTNLIDAKIDETDFSGVNFDEACLTLLELRRAYLADARFVAADLTRCNLEYIELSGANFERADFEDALLTGSHMPQANFNKANLRRTGLAEINWERADLRGADLRGATFHLGSSRSGLVMSPIASEGSRTGFYTDDFEEQDFKAPEEIRKANLRGADLRGAKITDVDFYLVDLRDALYDPEQERHFRRCGAILKARA